MGRVGEVIIRTWQTAHKMKLQRGALTGDTAAQRQLPRQALHRQVHHQSGHHPRHRARGRLDRSRASWPIWCCGSRPFSASNPALILKGGMIAAAAMGDPNASIPTPQPVHYRPMFGAFGGALAHLGHLRVAGGAEEPQDRLRWDLKKPLVTVRNTRKIGKQDMIHNDYHAQDRGRSGDLSGQGRRQAADLRAGESAADGAALLSCSERIL